MKKVLFPAAFATLLFAASCANNAPAGMSDADINAKADSIVGTRLDELNQQANEDLDRRMAIEVKPKADSMVEARKSNPAQ